MLARRNVVRWLAKAFEIIPAMQHDFPKPDIQIMQMLQNPIRTFAALGIYVSLADFSDVRLDSFACFISSELGFDRFV